MVFTMRVRVTRADKSGAMRMRLGTLHMVDLASTTCGKAAGATDLEGPKAGGVNDSLTVFERVAEVC